MYEEDVYLYLSSNASAEVYTSNTTSAFTNRIQSINLNSSKDYECALINVVFPKSIYTIPKVSPADESWAVNIHVKFRSNNNDNNSNANDGDFTFLWKFTPREGIIGENVVECLHLLQRQLQNDMKLIFKTDYGTYIHGANLHYSRASDRILIDTHGENNSEDSNAKFSEIALTFGAKIAKVLGLDPLKYYKIFKSNVVHENEFVPQMGLYSPRVGAQIDYFMVYCDIISSTRFADQNVNILDMFATGHANSKAMSPIVYKKLSVKSFDSVSLLITDQHGHKVPFEDNHTLACLLHIRPQ